jgi:hypothetical protein
MILTFALSIFLLGFIFPKESKLMKNFFLIFKIRAHDSKFTIFADQKEIKEYEHRVPLRFYI